MLWTIYEVTNPNEKVLVKAEFAVDALVKFLKIAHAGRAVIGAPENFGTFAEPVLTLLTQNGWRYAVVPFEV